MKLKKELHFDVSYNMGGPQRNYAYRNKSEREKNIPFI